MNMIELRQADAANVSNDGDAVLRGRMPSAENRIISHYWSIARRRKWVILGCMAGALLLGLIVTLLMTPQYTAVAVLEIQRETRNFTNVEGAQSDATSAIDQEFYETQYGLLRSRSLAQRVVQSLRLQDDPAFFEKFGIRATDWFTDGRPVPAFRNARIDAATTALLDHVNINPTRLSRLVELQFTGPNPQLSQRIAAAWVDHFIQSTLERRFGATAYARNFLEQRLSQLQTRINLSERKLVDYAAREGIINLPSSTQGEGDNGTSGERSLAIDDLATLNRELSRATADRIQAQSRINATRGETSEALGNDAITSLRARRAEVAADYAKLMSQFEPDYPPAKALQRQIAQLDQSIGREEARVTGSIGETFRASQAREQALAQRIDRLKTSVLDLRRRSIQYNIIQRDAGTNRQLYDALLQRYKEIGVAGGVGVNNISVVDPVELPKKPSSPRLLLNLAIALIAGTLLGAGAALIVEQLDEAISDPAEVEDILNVPLLGTTPKLAEGDPVDVLADVKSALTEAYLSVQTNLAFSTQHGVPRSIAVTSTRPAEGKSTTSFALARMLARSGRRTILIDGDMRSPSVHHIFKMRNIKGLSNYLSGADAIDDLVLPGGFDNLSVLTAGPQPPSTPELLAGDRVTQLLRELAANFDNVVIDAPPVMGFADAPLIGSQVESMIFVLESHGTKKSMARVALARLLAAKTQVAGAVLTKFDAKRAHYGYGYNYSYNYNYGDHSDAPKG
jgi:succinoglycan biosynthesis transport protein ExoP